MGGVGAVSVLSDGVHCVVKILVSRLTAYSHLANYSIAVALWGGGSLRMRLWTYFLFRYEEMSEIVLDLCSCWVALELVGT